MFTSFARNRTWIWCVRCVGVRGGRRWARRRRRGRGQRRAGDGQLGRSVAFSSPSAGDRWHDRSERWLDSVGRVLHERRKHEHGRLFDERGNWGLGRHSAGDVRPLHDDASVLQRRERGGALHVQRGQLLVARRRATAHVRGRLSDDAADDHQRVGARRGHAAGRVCVAGVARAGASHAGRFARSRPRCRQHGRRATPPPAAELSQ